MHCRSIVINKTTTKFIYTDVVAINKTTGKFIIYTVVA